MQLMNPIERTGAVFGWRRAGANLAGLEALAHASDCCVLVPGASSVPNSTCGIVGFAFWILF